MTTKKKSQKTACTYMKVQLPEFQVIASTSVGPVNYSRRRLAGPNKTMCFTVRTLTFEKR